MHYIKLAVNCADKTNVGIKILLFKKNFFLAILANLTNRWDQKLRQINMHLNNRQVIHPVIGNCMYNTKNATKDQFY
jgi:hypothetical protein